MISLTYAGNPVKKILLKLNLSDHMSILTDLQVTLTKPGQMTKPYSFHYFIANCFNAGNLKIEVKIINPFFEDYTELNNLNVPLELNRDQVDDLMPTIKEDEVVEEFRARNDARMDKMEYKRNNVVGALMNIPIFVGTFSILTDFAVLEDMDAYRDEGMGDVIFG
nr:hypothetical protein [Tanacetum cinerariifolium]